MAKKASKKPAAKVAAAKSVKKSAAPPARSTKPAAAAPAPKQSVKSAKVVAGPVASKSGGKGGSPGSSSKVSPEVKSVPAPSKGNKLVQGAMPAKFIKSGKGGAPQVARSAPVAAARPVKKSSSAAQASIAPRPIPVPVTTDGKPKKNQAGLTTKELEHYRELLLGKRRELVGDMSQMEREALRSAGGSNLSNLPLHMADMGTDNYEQEFTLGLVEKDRQLLREINQALAKIQDGSYGICEGTGKAIGKPRLDIMPWARISVEYARQKEQGFRRMG